MAWPITRQLLAGAVADPALRLDQAGPGGAVRRVASALKSLGDKP